MVSNHKLTMYGASLSLLLSFFYRIYSNPKSFSNLHELITNKYWLVSFMLIIAWSLYVLVFKNKLKIYKDEHQNEAIVATKQSLFGLLIAICHHLDMTVWIYWLIWIVSFYLEGWIA
jgi:hypothetical protein